MNHKKTTSISDIAPGKRENKHYQFWQKYQNHIR